MMIDDMPLRRLCYIQIGTVIERISSNACNNREYNYNDDRLLASKKHAIKLSGSLAYLLHYLFIQNRLKCCVGAPTSSNFSPSLNLCCVSNILEIEKYSHHHSNAE